MNKPRVVKYICVDTSNLIQSCLMEIEGDNINAINGLLEILDGGKAELILPEVIKLEFNKVLTIKTDKIKQNIGVHKLSINSDRVLDKKIKSELLVKLDEVMTLRERNTETPTQQIEKIFRHKNTHYVDLSPQLITEAYKIYLSGKKPSKGDSLSADAMIVTSLQAFLSDKINYELYLCSYNKADYAENVDTTVSQNGTVIHPDIESLFPHIEYYESLLIMLNEKFGKSYDPSIVEKMKEKNTELSPDLLSSIGSNETDIQPSPSPSPAPPNEEHKLLLDEEENK